MMAGLIDDGDLSGLSGFDHGLRVFGLEFRVQSDGVEAGM